MLTAKELTAKLANDLSKITTVDKQIEDLIALSKAQSKEFANIKEMDKELIKEIKMCNRKLDIMINFGKMISSKSMQKKLPSMSTNI